MADKQKDKRARGRRRKGRVRSKILGTAERPRLTVTKSLRNVFVQIVDDEKAATLEALSTNSKPFRELDFKGTKAEAAKKIGEMLARRAKEKGIEHVVFDRNRNRYHGRIKAVADGAREGGLKF